MLRINQVIAERMDRIRSGGERGVALVSAILFMVLLTGVSLVLLGVILGQIAPAYVAQKSTQTVYAAQAGLQAALGVVRSAATTDGSGGLVGDRTKLPCTFDGRLDGESDAVTYAVTIRYFIDDPTGRSDDWQLANSLPCGASGVPVQPNYAVAISEGQALAAPVDSDPSQGNRFISAVYKFRVANVNIPGGRIYDLARSNCLHAIGTTIGSEIRFRPEAQCGDDERQLWTYDDTYQIKLASSTGEGMTHLCVTGSTTNTIRATLQVCKTDATRWDQLWSWVGSSRWMGQQNPIANGVSNNCLASRVESSINYLTVSTGCGGLTFSPDPAVGAGGASYSTQQIVNYKEFGRCADVTDEDINKSFMMAYPCKQDPRGTGVGILWNHKWAYTEPPVETPSLGDQQIKVDAPSGQRCLQAPTMANKYPTFVTCSAGEPRQRWTRYADTGDYASSYLFVDTFGRCMAADSTDVYTTARWSRMTVTACDGSLAQKWNAPAIYNNSSFGGFKEISG